MARTDKRLSRRRPGQRRCSKRVAADCKKRKGWWLATEEFFSKGSTNKDNLHSHCRSCRRQITREWQKRNRAKRSEYQREWRKKNPERYQELQDFHHQNNRERDRAYAREYKKRNPVKNRSWNRKRQLNLVGNVTDEDWKSILDFYGHECLRCGSDEDLTMDHVIPVPEGPHDKSNIQPLCRRCNSSKGRRSTDLRFDKGAAFASYQISGI